MDKKTYDALQKSIAHWQENVAVDDLFKARIGTNDCALCDLFFVDFCKGCPVASSTGHIGCLETPYTHAREALGKAATDLANVDFIKAAKAEVLFLQSLVPAGGPE